MNKVEVYAMGFNSHFSDDIKKRCDKCKKECFIRPDGIKAKQYLCIHCLTTDD